MLYPLLFVELYYLKKRDAVKNQSKHGQTNKDSEFGYEAGGDDNDQSTFPYLQLISSLSNVKGGHKWFVTNYLKFSTIVNYYISKLCIKSYW